MNRLPIQVLTIALLILISAPLHAAKPPTVTDRAGRTTTVRAPFTRIISLYTAHTENLFALGLDQEIIGVSRGAKGLAVARNKNRFSAREDVEKFLAARPDLVLIRPMIERAHGDLVTRLRAAGITVVSLQPRTPQEMFAYWRDLGALTGRARQARAMIADFEKGRAAIAQRLAAIPASRRKHVYFEAIHAKMKTFAPKSMAIFVLTSAGGINVAADARAVRASNIAYYGKERLMSKGNEIDVFLAQKGRMNPVRLEDIYNEPGFAAIKAVRDHQVFLVDEAVVSRPTPRLLTGIKTIAALLYPEMNK